MYVIVRGDLPPTHQLIQSVHAVHEAGIRYGNPDQVSSMVVCTVPNEGELRRWAASVSLNNIKSYLFLEDDFGDQATAFATEPIEGEVRKLFKKLPLWKPEYEEATS